jgi:hypothetical protein
VVGLHAASNTRASLRSPCCRCAAIALIAAEMSWSRCLSRALTSASLQIGEDPEMIDNRRATVLVQTPVLYTRCKYSVIP